MFSLELGKRQSKKLNRTFLLYREETISSSISSKSFKEICSQMKQFVILYRQRAIENHRK